MTDQPLIQTADLCDQFADDHKLGIAAFAEWQHYGAHWHFYGEVMTVKCFEDNSKVKEQLALPGNGRVLVVDAGASQRRAHLGDMLAKQAIANGWVGLVIYGLIRDSHIINQLPIGVKALGTHPQKTDKRNEGQVGITLSFANIQVTPGNYLYADHDGIVVAKQRLHNDTE